jgi:glycosyltransferase involved in cell wall biosynthesis
MAGHRTLVFLLTEDWFFASHFWVRALAAKNAGWRVVLVARETAATQRIRDSGIEVVPVDFNRRRLNPFAELAFTFRLAQTYRDIKPDLVHHIALKPIVLGGIAARMAGVKAIVNAPVGLGFVFSSDKLLAKILRPLVALGLRFTLTPRHSIAVFENPDDMTALIAQGVARAEAVTLIRGAGVDIEKFHPTPEPEGPVRIVLIARMIREKGVPEFVEAARILRGRAEFILAGSPDEGNHNALTAAELRAWEAEGLVRWLGPVTDIPALLASAHIACQPSSYREGLPKSALEAMAAGKPMVATDIPGCREAVVNDDTGFLVPARDAQALAAALARLIDDPALRARFGAAGRARVEQNFSDAIVCGKTLALYESLVPDRSLL